jgi:coenzyme F420-0:L-glutamate ligase/coenzyme F420-1:gamma-L-glutamate ligase
VFLRTKGVARIRSLALTPLADFPDIGVGDDLVARICAGVFASGIVVRDGDVFVVAQKIVSKSENRYVDLAGVSPSPRAIEVANLTRKDPRLVEVILGESVRVVRAAPDVLIVEHRLGFVVANAGVDQSNVGRDAAERVLRLPVDPDASAEGLRMGLDRAFGVSLGVIVNDSFGRPWRRGTVGVALGVAGLPAIVDMRGGADRYGRALRATIVALADEIASAASLVMGQADEGQPVVHVAGFASLAPTAPARALLRPPGEDLFR